MYKVNQLIAHSNKCPDMMNGDKQTKIKKFEDLIVRDEMENQVTAEREKKQQKILRQHHVII
jgi:hypothetical protein